MRSPLNHWRLGELLSMLFALLAYASAVGGSVLWFASAFQTTIAPNQIRATVSVVEFAKCKFASAGLVPCSTAAGSQCACSTSPAGCPFATDCNGMELYRFRMSDGSVRGPYFAVPAPASFVIDGKWEPQPIP